MRTSTLAGYSIFEVNCSGYDSCRCWVLAHSAKTYDEFVVDVNTAIRDVGKQHIEGCEGWIVDTDWIESAVSYMVSSKGYIRLKPHMYKIGHDEIVDNEASEWCEIVGDDLFKLTLQKNCVVAKGRSSLEECYEYKPL
jgi:hypothetical protein